MYALSSLAYFLWYIFLAYSKCRSKRLISFLAYSKCRSERLVYVSSQLSGSLAGPLVIMIHCGLTLTRGDNLLPSLQTNKKQCTHVWKQKGTFRFKNLRVGVDSIEFNWIRLYEFAWLDHIYDTLDKYEKLGRYRLTQQLGKSLVKLKGQKSSFILHQPCIVTANNSPPK